MPSSQRSFFRSVKHRPAWMLTMLVVWTGWAAPRSCFGADPPQPRTAEQVRSGEDRVRGVLGILRRMDADENGSLEADEIPAHSQRYLQRWAELADLDLSKPFPIKELEKGVRRYYQSREQSAGLPLKRTREPTRRDDAYVRDFKPEKDETPVPGFGEDIDRSVVIVQADLDRAASRLRSYDRNHDGYMDRREATRGKWSDDPFVYDANRDGRLSRRELAVRYAKRRINEGRKERRSSTARSTAREKEREEYEARRRARQEHEREERRRREDPRNREAWYLSGSIMYRYDANRNGALEPSEFHNLGEKAASADADGGGRVDRRELAGWLLRVAQRPEHDLPPDLPEWFRLRDANADAQITMAEFTEEWTEDKVTEFTRYDLNSDGIVTPDECAGAASLPEGTYRNHRLQIIPAGRTTHSEIVVSDEEPIADLDVQISITHTYDTYLDAFLIGPRGERVELFTSVGSNDDHFDNTLFDDEALRPITSGRPPFKGAFQPEAVAKREPSLKQFCGKPIDGIWTLMIRAERSDRPGALHGWALIATQQEGENTEQPEGLELRHSEPERYERDRSEGDRR